VIDVAFSSAALLSLVYGWDHFDRTWRAVAIIVFVFVLLNAIRRLDSAARANR